MKTRHLLLALLLPACASAPHASPVAATPSAQPDYQAMYDELMQENGRDPAFFSHADVAYCAPLKRRLNLGEECVAPDQINHYLQLGQRMQAVQMKMPMDTSNQVDKTIADGIRRPLHAKAHACVKAFIQPVAGVGAPYTNGLFSDGKVHPAWIRFSNAKGVVENDDDKDARGMAVKVMGVSGSRLDNHETQTQDFLMTNKPRGTARNSEDFVTFAEVSTQGKLATLNYFRQGRGEQMLALLKVSKKKIDSMVKETYWSGGPFLWGQTPAGQPIAAKFKMEPCTDAKGALPDYLAKDIRADKPDAGYLKQDLKTLLGSHDLCMVMSLQIQKDVVKQPIEDGFELWSEKDVPSRTVAYVKIPKQTFDTDEQSDFCERMTFNPWNGLKDHRPLGDLNRARRYVYGAVQHTRLQALPAPQHPATGSGAEPMPNDAVWNISPLN